MSINLHFSLDSDSRILFLWSLANRTFDTAGRICKSSVSISRARHYLTRQNINPYPGIRSLPTRDFYLTAPCRAKTDRCCVRVESCRAGERNRGYDFWLILMQFQSGRTRSSTVEISTQLGLRCSNNVLSQCKLPTVRRMKGTITRVRVKRTSFSRSRGNSRGEFRNKHYSLDREIIHYRIYSSHARRERRPPNGRVRASPLCCVVIRR